MSDQGAGLNSPRGDDRSDEVVSKEVVGEAVEWSPVGALPRDLFERMTEGFFRLLPNAGEGFKTGIWPVVRSRLVSRPRFAVRSDGDAIRSVRQRGGAAPQSG